MTDKDELLKLRYDILYKVAVEVKHELRDAYFKFPRTSANNHEAYAVLLEETDELWDEIKKKDPDQEKVRNEAIQVAAMAIRMIVDMEIRNTQ